MRKLIIILFVLSASFAQGQGITKQFGNGYKNVNGFHFGWFDGTDTIAYFKAAGLLMKKPIFLNVWTTAGRPSTPVPGTFGFNSDSATIEWYSNAWYQPGAGSGGGGGSSYTFSTGLTNSSGTVTNNLSTGVSGGQTLIGSTSTTSGLTYKATTGVGTTGADHIWVGGNNGGTEFMRILNNGNIGIGTNSPGSKLTVANGGSKFDCFDGSDVFGNITIDAASNNLRLNFTRTLSSGLDLINFNGGNYIYNNSGTGEVRLFANSGNNFLTVYSNGSERMRFNTAGKTLIGTTSDNTIGLLQIAGKVTVATIDSSAAANMLWADPSTGEIKKAAVPTGGTSDLTGGAIKTNIQIVNDVDYTIASTDYAVVYKTTTTTRTITLPSAATSTNRMLMLKNGGASSVSTSISMRESTGTTVSSIASAEGYSIISDGTDWWIVTHSN